MIKIHQSIQADAVLCSPRRRVGYGARCGTKIAPGATFRKGNIPQGHALFGGNRNKRCDVAGTQNVSDFDRLRKETSCMRISGVRCSAVRVTSLFLCVAYSCVSPQLCCPVVASCCAHPSCRFAETSCMRISDVRCSAVRVTSRLVFGGQGDEPSCVSPHPEETWHSLGYSHLRYTVSGCCCCCCVRCSAVRVASRLVCRLIQKKRDTHWGTAI